MKRFLPWLLAIVIVLLATGCSSQGPTPDPTTTTDTTQPADETTPVGTSDMTATPQATDETTPAPESTSPETTASTNEATTPVGGDTTTTTPEPWSKEAVLKSTWEQVCQWDKGSSPLGILVDKLQNGEDISTVVLPVGNSATTLDFLETVNAVLSVYNMSSGNRLQVESADVGPTQMIITIK